LTNEEVDALISTYDAEVAKQEAAKKKAGK